MIEMAKCHLYHVPHVIHFIISSCLLFTSSHTKTKRTRKSDANPIVFIPVVLQLLFAPQQLHQDLENENHPRHSLRILFRSLLLFLSARSKRLSFPIASSSSFPGVLSHGSSVSPIWQKHDGMLMGVR
jgi:hypothetical protein